MDLSSFQNMGEDAASSMAHALTTLLGRDVSVSLSAVDEKETNSFSKSLNGKYLCAILKCFNRENLLVFLLTKEKDSSLIADLLIGQDGSRPVEIMSELHYSAFNEVVQQMVEALDSSAKIISNNNKTFRLKDITLIDSTLVENKLLLNERNLVVISFGIFVQGLLSSEIIFCLPGSVVNVLINDKESADRKEPSEVIKDSVSENIQKQAGGVVVEQLENESAVLTRPVEGNIGLLLDVPLKMTVELGRTTKLVKEILALAPGSVVELDKLAGEAVDILINEKLIAKGEVVVIDENFGVRITEILNPEERLTAVQS